MHSKHNSNIYFKSSLLSSPLQLYNQCSEQHRYSDQASINLSVNRVYQQSAMFWGSHGMTLCLHGIAQIAYESHMDKCWSFN